MQHCCEQPHKLKTVCSALSSWQYECEANDLPGSENEVSRKTTLRRQAATLTSTLPRRSKAVCCEKAEQATS